MQSWPVQTAKARLAELVKLAGVDGPQDITRHGRSVAVVMSRQQFDRLTGGSPSLTEFMRHSPLYGQDDLDFERESSVPRDPAF